MKSEGQKLLWESGRAPSIRASVVYLLLSISMAYKKLFVNVMS
jgi:hypothetical protein